MEITFVSNYINHHQIPFSEAMVSHLGDRYHFIQTELMEEERIHMGWSANPDAISYVICYYENPQECERLIAESDVVIFGGVEQEELIEKRLKEGKIVIRNSERIYKEGQWKAISPRGLKKKFQDHIRYRNAPVYLLCSGGYVASDFHLIGAYPYKMFRWGYFPETKQYEKEYLYQRKSVDHTVRLIWVGRFIDWKHPEYAVRLAEELKIKGYDFHIQMIGGGKLEDSIRKQVIKNNLEDVVELSGFRKPWEVRLAMEQAHIHLFTSDYKEGWGVVLNEAMNSGCVPVVNCALGAAPFLIKHGENGFLYQNGNFDQFEARVIELLEDTRKRRIMADNAYRTIVDTWNAQNAAEKLLKLCYNLVDGKPTTEGLPMEGPCSLAPAISPRKMFSYLCK